VSRDNLAKDSFRFPMPPFDTGAVDADAKVMRLKGISSGGKMNERRYPDMWKVAGFFVLL
jgi:hypothetical protein